MIKSRRGGECSTHGRDETLGELRGDERKISKWILK
jgi:hypothetical protein